MGSREQGSTTPGDMIQATPAFLPGAPRSIHSYALLGSSLEGTALPGAEAAEPQTIEDQGDRSGGAP